MSRIDPGHPSATAPLLAGLSMALAMCFSTSVHAVPRIDGLSADQMSVYELMRLDTEQALMLVRSRTVSSGTPDAHSTQRSRRSMTGEPLLKAIYGVGNQLMAEVVVDDITYFYRHGQALPTGVAPGDDVLLLQKISARCVDLGNADRSHHLCLRPAQWVAK